jgi:hypothetical protein
VTRLFEGHVWPEPKGDPGPFALGRTVDAKGKKILPTGEQLRMSHFVTLSCNWCFALCGTPIFVPRLAARHLKRDDFRLNRHRALLFRHDLRTKAFSRLSRGKTGFHLFGSCFKD